LEDTSALEDLQNDERTLLAVVRALEVVGEAAKRIPKDFQSIQAVPGYQRDDEGYRHQRCNRRLFELDKAPKTAHKVLA